VDVEVASQGRFVVLNHHGFGSVMGHFSESCFSFVEFEAEAAMRSPHVVGEVPLLSAQKPLFMNVVPHDAEGVKLKCLWIALVLVVLGNLRKVGALLGGLLEQMLSIVGSPDFVEGES
jgi:hypothetical protein